MKYPSRGQPVVFLIAGPLLVDVDRIFTTGGRENRISLYCTVGLCSAQSLRSTRAYQFRPTITKCATISRAIAIKSLVHYRAYRPNNVAVLHSISHFICMNFSGSITIYPDFLLGDEFYSFDLQNPRFVNIGLSENENK